MIDTGAIKNSLIDMATTGLLTQGFKPVDVVSDTLQDIPTVSSKRKKLLLQEYEYGNKPQIPEHWVWVRLGEISTYGDTPKKTMAAECDNDTWILELEDIEAGGRLLVKKKVSQRQSKGEKTEFKAGQVLYSKLRPYLKKVLIADEKGISTPELISFDVLGGINNKYILFCLLSSFTNRAIDKRSYGIKMPRVDAGFMVNLPIPLPPLSEQAVIVEKMENALSQINHINMYQEKYSSDLELLKSKLLEAGLQGLLTEQMENDGKAEDLLEELSLTEKNSVPIDMSEIPYDIPDNWKWCRLSDIGTTNIGLTYHPEDVVDDGVFVVRSSNILNGQMDYSDSVKVNCPIRENQFLNKNDIVICARNGSKALVGKRAIYEGEPNTTSFGAFMAVFRTPFYKYVYYYLGSNVFRRYFSGDDSKQINQVTQNILKNAIIPLPPISEQKRITDLLDMINRIA